MTQKTELHTNVLGYFNPNDHPIQVIISKLNIRINLDPKQFVLDKQGRRINDPILESYCGPHRLTSEKSDEKSVPILRFTPPEQVPNDERFAFRGSAEVKQDAHGRITELPSRTTQLGKSSDPQPTRGYTVEQAVRLGLINVPKPADQPDSTGLQSSPKPNPIPKQVTPPSEPTAQAVQEEEEEEELLGADGYQPPTNFSSIVQKVAAGLLDSVKADPATEVPQVEIAEPAAPVAPKKLSRAEIRAAKAAKSVQVPEPEV